MTDAEDVVNGKGLSAILVGATLLGLSAIFVNWAVAGGASVLTVGLQTPARSPFRRPGWRPSAGGAQVASSPSTNTRAVGETRPRAPELAYRPPTTSSGAKPTNRPCSTMPVTPSRRAARDSGSAMGPKRQSRMLLPPSVT